MSTVTANLPLNIFRPKEALLSMFSNDIRPDGRKLNEIRQFEVTKLPVAKKLELDNFQSNSWVLSSVQVRFGQTLVLGVVSGSIRYPKVEGDNCGDLGMF
jgi:exosome complex RNA-binding protein Rrp42 (RNase PH superfamily)